MVIGVFLIVCVIIFFITPVIVFVYLIDKDWSDYDLLWGNFNLYNLLHRKKIKE